MARKCGKNNVMKVAFSNYSYIINGVGGIGKTTMVYEIGKQVTGSDEGTLIISLGKEPTPEHIDGAFYERASEWDDFDEIVDELCDNKKEYPNTKFIALDSMDEMFRIAETYVVAEYNSSPSVLQDATKRAKVIGQAYGGFQRGENRVIDIVLDTIFKLDEAGYKLLPIGHTKIKTKTDTLTEITYEQLTCNLDNKYYNAIKDKVNLVATCYIERKMTNVKDVKDAFTKTTKKKGTLEEEKRMIAFRDEDDSKVDTKSHFKNIVPKVAFSTENFIKCVEDAIVADLEEKRGVKVTDKDLKTMAKEQSNEKVETPKKVKAIDLDKNAELIEAIKANADKIDMEKMQAIMTKYDVVNFEDISTIKTKCLEEIKDLI